MALDAVMLKIAADELRGQLVGTRVDKIFMPARDTVLFHVRNENGVQRLLVSARSGTARVHFTEETFDNPATPPAFCMLLRKHLGSGRFKDIRTVDGERVIFFDFEAINEMGDRVQLMLSVELMGRYSNIVLVNGENRVIDALKHIDADQSDKRQLLPGVAFTMPPAQDKLPFLGTATEALAAEIRKKNKPLSSAILDVTAGIGPVVCREIALRTAAAVDPEADTLDDAARARLTETIAWAKAAANGEGRTLTIVCEGEKPIEFSFIPLSQYGDCPVRRFDTVSKLLDSYYAARDRAELMRARSADLKRQVQTLLERTLRRQHAREEELGSTEKAEKKRIFGELLTANLPQLQKGMTEARLLDYYTGLEVVIPIDPQKTPVQNVQKYYRDYRKLTTAQKVLAGLLAEGKEEIEYLESVRYEVEVAKTEEEFLNIRRELREAGYLKAYRAPKGKPRKTEPFFHYRTSDGFEVLVGRNNAANERLTLRTAAKGDIWFHVKDGAGSHTVLIAGDGAPGDAAMTEAAIIAAFNSEMRHSEQVPVDYTEIRYVKKAPGQKPGMVIYTNQKTAFVRPDQNMVKELEVAGNSRN